MGKVNYKFTIKFQQHRVPIMEVNDHINNFLTSVKIDLPCLRTISIYITYYTK